MKLNNILGACEEGNIYAKTAAVRIILKNGVILDYSCLFMALSEFNALSLYITSYNAFPAPLGGGWSVGYVDYDQSDYKFEHFSDYGNLWPKNEDIGYIGYEFYDNYFVPCGQVDTTDDDKDGLYDIYELTGMRIANGQVIFTNTNTDAAEEENETLGFDTDGDGLSDGEEIIRQDTERGYFVIKSNPNSDDGDSDGIYDICDIEPLDSNEYHDLVIELVNSGKVTMEDNLQTSDGFVLVNIPLSKILDSYNIKEISYLDTLNKEHTFNADDFAHWYFYSVDANKLSILKMRPYENGNARVGVSIPFIELDGSLMLKSFYNFDKYENSLYTELDKITKGKVDTNTYSEEITKYFSNPYSKANYLIAETYIDKVIESDCDDSNEIAVPFVNERIKEYLVSTNGIYNENDNCIKISDKDNLSLPEKQAILSVRTGNTSFNSFAAEVIFHAVWTTRSAQLIDLYTITGSIFSDPAIRLDCLESEKLLELILFDSAVKADMGVDEEEESGVSDKGYYGRDGKYVKEQRIIWGDY